MQKKQHTSNRTQRRAAERAALKAARKSQPQLAVVAANNTLAATACDHHQLPPANLSNIDIGAVNHAEHSYKPANSEKAGGPRTEAGKQSSSRNALKHGGCAVTTLILESESYQDFLALEAEVFESFKLDANDPNANKGEVALIREAVRANWFYRRSENNYSETEGKMLNEAPNTLMWGEVHHRTLARFQRYRTANYNLLVKARKAVDDYRKARNREAADSAKVHREQQKLIIAKDRLEIYREKNKPFDFDEEIEAMRQKAIRLGFHDQDTDPPADLTGY